MYGTSGIPKIAPLNPFFLGIFHRRTKSQWGVVPDRMWELGFLPEWLLSRYCQGPRKEGVSLSVHTESPLQPDRVAAFLSCCVVVHFYQLATSINIHSLACPPGLAPHSLASHPLSLALVWTRVIVYLL